MRSKWSIDVEDKFCSSRLVRKLRDVCGIVWPSEVQKGKRRSNSHSTSGEEFCLPFDDTISSNEESTYRVLLMGTAMILDEELAQMQRSDSNFSQHSASPIGKNVRNVTQKTRQKTKVPPIQKQTRGGTYLPARSFVNGSSEIRLGGQETATVEVHRERRHRRENTCHCGGKCSPGSSGSSRQSPSSSLSPQRS